MKIKSKLTIMMLLVSIIPLFGFAFFAITRVTDRVRKDHIQLLENAAFNSADKIDRFLQQRYWEIQSWVTLDIPEVALEFDTHERLNQLLNQLVQTYSGYSHLMVFDTDGMLFAINDVDSTGQEVDVSGLWRLSVKDELWYNRSLQGEFVVGDPELQEDAKTGNKGYIVRLSAPIVGEKDNTLGVWVSVLDWRSIHHILSLAQNELHQRGFVSALVFLLSKDGSTFVDYPDRIIIGTSSADYNLSDISAESVDKATGYTQREWGDRQRSVGFSRIRDKLSWICAVSIDDSEIFAPVARLNHTFIYSVLGISTIIFVTIYCLSRRISQPIVSISQSTKAIAKGNFDHTVASASKDEIGELAASFNDMAQSLKEYQTKLRDHSRMLETTVEERTGALRRSEEKFRSLFEQAPVGIALQLEDGRIASANTVFRRMFGYDEQELAELNISSLYTPPKHIKFRRSTDGNAEEIELFMKRKDGSVFPASLSTRKLKYEGKEAYETIIQDLSIRKELEDQIKAERDFNKEIIDTIDLFIAAVNIQDSSIILFSQGAEKISGYRRDEVLGQVYEEVFIPEHMRDEVSKLSRLVKNSPGKEFTLNEQEIPIVTKNGEERLLSWTTAFLRDPAGNPTGTIAFGLDITEKKKMEEQLVQSERLRALGEMASGVAHDFNNVLAAIVGNAQLIMLSTSDPGVVAGLQTIEQAAKDGAETVKRIQEFSRVRKDVAHVGVDMNQIIRDVMAITSPRWKDQPQGRGITIDLEAALEADESIVAGNAAELREVFTNFIFNAIDAMPGGGKILIETRNESNYIIITVADTGTGMPDDVKRKIFEPFFSTKGVGNSGLGLSVSYGIIKRHDGQITVDSKAGEGTRFTVKLPLDLKAELEKQRLETMEETESARILVIDDEDGIRQLVSTILSKNGHEIQTAEKGAEGLQIFKQDPFDIVITDLGMPQMSGYEVADKVKLIEPRTPVIMVTGWGAQLDEEKLKQSGIDLVLSKPFDVSTLVNKVSEAVQIRKLM